MPSNFNLNIKYGNKARIPENPSAGNILAAKNSVGEIEMYIDTPEVSSKRKRLDPRIFVGGLSDVNIPGNPSATDAAKTAAIWENYDVWIDTDGDPTGTATNNSSGLMSSTHVDTLTRTYNTLSALKAELDKLKLQIVSQSYWNTTDLDENTDEYINPRNIDDTDHLSGWLTIVLPDSAVPPEGGNHHPGSDEPDPEIFDHVFEIIDTSSIVVPNIDLAINNSDGFGSDGGSGS